jgi:FkbM family methyltransferase
VGISSLNPIYRAIRKFAGLHAATSQTAAIPDPARWFAAHQPFATDEDIFYCFRLILGRSPNPEEWRGHSARVGEPLEGIVASYVKSLEFSARGLLNSDRLDHVILSRLARFQIYTSADDVAVGKHVDANNYEPDVTQVFLRYLRPGMGVLDIGANIGYFTMLSASIVGPEGYVLALEPNPRNARMLEASRRVNQFDQVVLSQTAAGPQTGLLVLHTSHSNGTTSDLPGDLAGLLDGETVPCIRPDALVRAGRRIDFIKVDVEGAEFNAMQGCEDIIHTHRPMIVSEFSPTRMPDSGPLSGISYLRWLVAMRYGLSVIEPDGAELPFDQNVDGIIAKFKDRLSDHIDVLAKPL